MIDRYCENGLHTLGFHLMNHVVKDLERFINMEMQDASPFQLAKQHFTRAIRSASQRRVSGIMKAVEVMGEERKENITMCEGGGEPREFQTVNPWKQMEQNRLYVVWNADRRALPVIEKSGNGVSVSSNKGQIACPLVKIFKRNMMKSFMHFSQEFLERQWELVWM